MPVELMNSLLLRKEDAFCICIEKKAGGDSIETLLMGNLGNIIIGTSNLVKKVGDEVRKTDKTALAVYVDFILHKLDEIYSDVLKGEQNTSTDKEGGPEEFDRVIAEIIKRKIKEMKE